MMKKSVVFGCIYYFFEYFFNKKVLFLTFFNVFLNSFQLIKTDSYDTVCQIIENGNFDLIVIDLFEVGVEYKNQFFHTQNKKMLNQLLRIELKDNFRIKAYKESLKEEGLNEIPEFLYMYERIRNKNLVLITDNHYYVPYDSFNDFKCNYDSYKNGVIFYKGKMWVEIISNLACNYQKIVFISSNEKRLKEFLKLFPKCLAIKFCRKREPLKLKDFNLNFD